MALYPLLIAVLFGTCFGGLAFSLISAVRKEMQDYEQVHLADTARQFEDLFLFIPPARLLKLARAAAIAAFLVAVLVFGDFQSPGGWARGLLLGAAAAWAALYAPRLALRLARTRRLRRFNQQLPDTLMTMSNALRSGYSILQAFEAVVKEGRNPIAQEFGVFLQQNRVGLRFEDALRQMEQRVASEDLTLMVLAVETARQTGGNLTEIFDRIAMTVRERLRIEERVRALTAQGRLQGIIVGAIPLFLLMVMAVLDPPLMNAFFASRAGWSLLVVVLVMEGVGAWLIRRIIRIRV